MAYTTGVEYRKERRKDLPLPSGALFLIKKPGPLTSAQLFKIMGVSDKILETTTEEEFDEIIDEARKNLPDDALAELLSLLLTNCVVAPKVVDYATAKDDELWVEDIDPVDFGPLFEGILKFTGETREEAEGRSFPGEELPGEVSG